MTGAPDLLRLPPRRTREGPARPVAATAARLEAFRALVDRLWPRAEGRRVVDLGAGHGLFAQVMARRGFAVTAVDARPRWSAAEALGLPARGAPPGPLPPGIAWEAGDARSFDTAPFDIVLAIGLTYHLSLAAQRDLLARTRGQPTVIDTEVYDPDDPVAAASPRLRPATLEGLPGALCRETGHVWSAIDGAESFWPTHVAMLRMAAEAGRAATVVEPAYRSRFGWRRWYVLDARAA